MAPGGPQGCSNQRNDKLSTSECAEGCWRSRRLEALVSTGTAWEHLLQRGACRKWVSSVLSCLAAATQSWTYRLSRRMSSCGWMEQQWLKIGCCHGRLLIVAWGMTLLWTMLTTYCAFWQPPACRKECHSCTRRKTQLFVSEVAPEGSLQGFQIPYIEGRQPGALNSKGHAAAVGNRPRQKRQYSSVAHEWIIPRGSPSTRWPSPKTRCFSSLVDAEQSLTQRTKAGFFTQILQGMTSDHSCRRTD